MVALIGIAKSPYKTGVFLRIYHKHAYMFLVFTNNMLICYWYIAMKTRLYQELLTKHLQKHRQMAFFSGPRQVGKSTLVKSVADCYWSADIVEDREAFLKGPRHFGDMLGLNKARSKPYLIAMDELHKIGPWKRLLKGFFDLYEDQVRVMVTGSSRLDIYRKGGDSLMGRYLHYHVHPFSLGELLHGTLPGELLRPSAKADRQAWSSLMDLGGFPEPLIKGDPEFARSWRMLRRTQVLREDLRDLTTVRDLTLIEHLLGVLERQSGAQMNMSNLARDLGTSLENIRRWINVLCSLHQGFLLRPWAKGVRNSLRREPKWYLRDWSGIADPGARAETLLACHLLKAIDLWNDLGKGVFELGYLRDKQKREVDFCVIKDGKVWILAEAKHADSRLADSLKYFAEQLKPEFALQAVANLEYESLNCFQSQRPMVVPMASLLAQLP